MFLAFVLLIAAGIALILLFDRMHRLEWRIGLLERELRRLTPESSAELAAQEAPQPSSAEAEPDSESTPGVEAEAQRLAAFSQDNGPVRDAPLPAAGDEPDGPGTGAGDAEALQPELEPQQEGPAPESAPAVARGRRPFGFEDLFGRLLPIWAGGVTLAVAGMLIVKYSIDLGLLSPLVRVINGLIFGFVLIAAAELARRRQSWMRDERVRQALAGAGIATLYASILVAANVYGLIGPLPALAGMAGVTALAMALALRFGAPSALLGLVGGLAAPALVGTGDPDIPLLSLYLALAVGGLCALSRSQRWLWLGIASLAGGFGWGGLLLLGGRIDTAASLSIGAYLMLLGVLLPAFSFGGAHQARLRLGGSLVAAAQMAGLVATGGFTLLHWGLFGLISIAILWLSGRDPRLSLLPPVGQAIALLLLAAWPDPPAGAFAIALAGIALIYGGPALLTLWSARGRIVEAGQIAAIALGALLASMFHFHGSPEASDQAFALLAAGAALMPAGAAFIGWRLPARHEDGRFAVLASTAAILAAAAAVLALPGWIEGPAVAAVAAGLLGLRLASRDVRIEPSAWAGAAIAILVLLVQMESLAELARAFGAEEAVGTGRALLRWTLCGAAAVLFAWRGTWPAGRKMAQVAAVLLLYCAAAQALPASLLPLVPATAALALSWWSRRVPAVEPLAALGTLLALVLGWAFVPIVRWSAFALESIAGDPLLAADLPGVSMAATRLLAPALLLGLSSWLVRPATGPRPAAAGAAAAGAMGGIALHILYKQIFALSGPAEFVALGMAERSLWEVLLLGAAAVAWAKAPGRPWLRLAAAALCAVAVGHFLLYSLILHNPLWAAQAVGPVPLFNLLLAAFAVPFAAGWLLLRHEPEVAGRHERLLAAAAMLLIALGAFSLLRQLFHGSILTGGGVGDIEDIARSILAIGLALGFLVWGIARSSRDWRIGSLILMLAAVAKVFLLDASGLEGLARILSFVALGFSLIGIGWLYSRYLTGEKAAPGD